MIRRGPTKWSLFVVHESSCIIGADESLLSVYSAKGLKIYPSHRTNAE